MRSPHPLRTLVVLLLVSTLAACGDDDSSSETLSGESDGPVVSIEVDDTGWSVATSGFVPSTGDVPIGLANTRGDEATVQAFLTPDGYELGEPPPDGTDFVLDETLAAGAEEQLDVTFEEAGDYAVYVDPVATGDLRRLGGGFTIGDG